MATQKWRQKNGGAKAGGAGAGGTPLAVTQEDCLVILCIYFSGYYKRQTELIFPKCSLQDLYFISVFLIETCYSNEHTF